MLRELETGIPTCVTVTLVDGLVLARSAFHHSMNYRSVVAFGSARKIADPERKVESLCVLSPEHLIPGRWADVRKPSEKELKATTVLEFSISEASSKVRSGPPLDDESDYELPVWAGVLPLAMNFSSAPTRQQINQRRRSPGLRPALDSRIHDRNGAASSVHQWH